MITELRFTINLEVPGESGDLGFDVELPDGLVCFDVELFVVELFDVELLGWELSDISWVAGSVFLLQKRVVLRSFIQNSALYVYEIFEKLKIPKNSFS